MGFACETWACVAFHHVGLRWDPPLIIGPSGPNRVKVQNSVHNIAPYSGTMKLCPRSRGTQEIFAHNCTTVDMFKVAVDNFGSPRLKEETKAKSSNGQRKSTHNDPRDYPQETRGVHGYRVYSESVGIYPLG
ncbi:hypothetical protein CRG98_024553 [Punica granatum]|uniref:Uncharacterized protein n=1 Tax=Punica granatum TaxID=22663 RepID=A0A2I0JHE6_PUNGR|nr:hypothetical protein CRG98_024553 [Punica granatum]